MLRRWFVPVLLLLSCGEAGPPGDPKARIVSFTATPEMVMLGEEVVLAWEIQGARDVIIEPRVGLQGPKGTATDKPLVTTTYVLSIPGGPKELIAEITVQVGGNNPRVTTFTASPRTLMQGESSTLEWITTDADEVEIQPDLGSFDPQGSLQITPELTTTYSLIARRGNQVSPPSEVTVVVASGNQPFIRTFEASPQTVQIGSQVTLSWEAVNTDAVTINPGLGQQPVSGSITVMPQETTTYTLTAVGPGDRRALR
jgi:hypothetical protein